MQKEKKRAVATALEKMQAQILEPEQAKLAAAQQLREREKEFKQLELAAQKVKFVNCVAHS